MRVFIGPVEVAGLGAGLQAGLRACGVRADLVCTVPHPFAYDSPPDPSPLHRLWGRLGRWRAAIPRSRLLSKALSVVLHQTVGWWVVGWSLMRYDAFVFMFGRTITNSVAELVLLRLFRKRAVVVFQGSDARPAYIDGSLFPSNRAFDPALASAVVARQCRRVQSLERWASVVVNARATAQFHRRPFLNWFALGIPRTAAPAPPPGGEGPVRVLHSPSHPVLKGTAEIRSVVERLQARGLSVELVTIQGRPNAEVLEALRHCDLVVDQLYSDTPMAAFAAEAASLGRAVIVCGCAAQNSRAQVRPLPLPPTAYVRPEALEATLEALVRDPVQREALAHAGAAFVAREWSPVAVGSRLLRMIQGDIPPEWWCEPGEVDHVVGCGLAESEARARVMSMIRHGGVAALQTRHNPTLERSFAAFAGMDAP